MTKQESKTGYNHSIEAIGNPRLDERLTQTGEGGVAARKGSILGPRKRAILSDPDWDELEGTVMQFRLTYQGPLRASTRNERRTRQKHEVRKALHPQLKRLWEEHPALANRPSRIGGGNIYLYEYLADNYPRGHYNFVPLVTNSLHLTCGLDVLFLRPEAPGQALKSGDIDNRLKTLFDALRIPASMDEMGGYDTPDESEQPFYCLLEDDSLVSQLSVETDTLLETVNGGFDTESARLVITVTVKTYFPELHNLGLG